MKDSQLKLGMMQKLARSAQTKALAAALAFSTIYGCKKEEKPLEVQVIAEKQAPTIEKLKINFEVEVSYIEGEAEEAKQKVLKKEIKIELDPQIVKDEIDSKSKDLAIKRRNQTLEKIKDELVKALKTMFSDIGIGNTTEKQTQKMAANLLSTNNKSINNKLDFIEHRLKKEKNSQEK